MLLSEMVRRLSGEQNLLEISERTPSPLNQWADIETVNVNLSQDSLLIYKYDLYGPTNVYIRARWQIDSAYYIGGEQAGYSNTETHGGFFLLSAGSHTIVLQAYANDSSARIRNIYLGVVDLADLSGFQIQNAGSGALNAISSRKTCLGSLNEAFLLIQVYNEGGTPTVTVDGESATLIASDNYKYVFGEAVSAGADHNISVSAGYMTAAMSPWLLGDGHQPLTLDFPQGSTLYLTLEPLFLDPAKALKIGKKRAVSFGDSTDYYYTASGTGILQANYTFEMVEVEGCILQVSGLGACISIIGVDVR